MTNREIVLRIDKALAEIDKSKVIPNCVVRATKILSDLVDKLEAEES